MTLQPGRSPCPCSSGSLPALANGAVYETYITTDKLHDNAGPVVGNTVYHLIQQTCLFLGVMLSDCLGVATRCGRCSFGTPPPCLWTKHGFGFDDDP
jgi:hypothetical protein